MISFRYHVVSLVAVLLALATGVVLGSGPLQREDTGDAGAADRAALAEAREQLDTQNEALRFDDAFAAGATAQLVAGRLKGRPVTVVSLPGADETTVARLEKAIGTAGGSVAARVMVAPGLLDVENRQLVSELARQVQGSAKGAVSIPAGVSGYERMGRLLAYAIGTRTDAGTREDGTGESIMAALATADLVTTRGNLSRRGSLVLLVAGDPQGTADDREGAGNILATLTDALDARTDGVVLAGPISAGAEDGLVEAVRSDPTAAVGVSTVDVADRSAGAPLTVLALRRQASGKTGHYGTADAPDGAFPSAG